MDNLSQVEADELLSVEKHSASDEVHAFPATGEHLTLKLVTADEREFFNVDINRRSIALNKCTFNGRARSAVILARLDLNGAPHRNPDGEELPCPHLHLYREGYADKWAFPVPPGAFSDLSDLRTTCSDFLAYFNVTRPPVIQKDLLTP
ncbi:MAG TPA: hypothetical protein VN155_00595 [Devosia sp.]|nr:hypothetical protein [Devosia sp.]